MRVLPLRDHAVIGDCHGSALVAKDGTIDWCCLGRFDAEPVLAALLDEEKGGFLAVRPAGPFRSEHAYVEKTNIVRTTFATESGRLAVTDFMPVGRIPSAGVHEYSRLRAPGLVVRIVEVLEGSVPVELEYRGMIDFARRPAALGRHGPDVVTGEGTALTTDMALFVEGDRALARETLLSGERRVVVLGGAPLGALPDAEKLRRVTESFWREWSAYCRYDGPHRDAVLRSALVLKLLAYAPTGAIAAAPTTSLPEKPGGVRNWDYRYCWLRDAAFTLYALASLGYHSEARRFAEFLWHEQRIANPRLQILYRVDGDRDVREHDLRHLAGFERSRPVRVGNAAAEQRQLDIYGEILDWALLYESLGGEIDAAGERFVERLASFVCEHWREPGQGIWEMRGEPRHHTYSKIMGWVALDRAIQLIGETPERAAARDELRRSVLEEGTGELGFRQAYGLPYADASLLMVPALGFPAPRELVERTVAGVQRKLAHGHLVRRYDSTDGLRRGEGAFVACSFWLADALLALDRPDEAREVFEGILAERSPLGLLSEEVHLDTHALLGNYPQGLSHLALVQTVLNFDLHARHGAKALWGSHRDRAALGSEAVLDLEHLWVKVKQSWRTKRVTSSRASRWPEAA